MPRLALSLVSRLPLRHRSTMPYRWLKPGPNQLLRPRLGNQYVEDTALRDLLRRITPEKTLNEIEPDLIRLGDR